MKRIKLIIFFAALALSPALYGQITTDITKSFKAGDADLLAVYFNSRIKLSIFDKEYEPSQTQGKEIMREFFRDHPPVSFELKFESAKKDSKFIIGSLKTKSGNYRVNVFFKKFDGKDLIHLLKIEKENASTI